MRVAVTSGLIEDRMSPALSKSCRILRCLMVPILFFSIPKMMRLDLRLEGDCWVKVLEEARLFPFESQSSGPVHC